MKKSIFVLISFVFFTAASSGGDIHKELKVGPGKTLEMNLESGGDITVTGWERDAVSVDVYFKGGNEDDYRVTIDEPASGVAISSRYARRRRRTHYRNVTFEVHVPKKFDLDLESNGGDITLRGIEGNLEGTTMGGSMEFAELKGKVNFHTMGGNITLTTSEVDGEVKTNGGKVLLEDVTGNVNGHSMGGAVTYKNVTDRSGSSTGDVERISSMGGAISLSDAPHGAEVSTMGGDIDISSAAKYVKAKTMGGDITIKNMDGWVRAETMGGNVDVTMVGKASEGKRDVTLTSKGGDIYLTVPSDLSMDVDIRLAYTDGFWRDNKSYSIESDFDLAQERTKDWDEDYGTRRKYIYGTGSINGGRNKIHIETINGNVYLKKGR